MNISNRIALGILLLCLLLCAGCGSSRADTAEDRYAAGYDDGFRAGYEAALQEATASRTMPAQESSAQTTARSSNSGDIITFDFSEPEDEPEDIDRNAQIVYVTRTGSKYHKEGCSYLKSKIPLSLSDAIDAGYEPCSKCRPPS